MITTSRCVCKFDHAVGHTERLRCPDLYELAQSPEFIAVLVKGGENRSNPAGSHFGMSPDYAEAPKETQSTSLNREPVVHIQLDYVGGFGFPAVRCIISAAESASCLPHGDSTLDDNRYDSLHQPDFVALHASYRHLHAAIGQLVVIAEQRHTSIVQSGVTHLCKRSPLNGKVTV
ncbi:hypothetical protein RRG08_045951 [Elysia crispata]|uniref:Uncharacterized protein n=1 Tax=Elysia crispata TaxID=231223 RepID=A0AAE1AR90_9GAST|nr:hypothetical protein RRG08_045951 [Elysia crispata]